MNINTNIPEYLKELKLDFGIYRDVLRFINLELMYNMRGLDFCCGLIDDLLNLRLPTCPESKFGSFKHYFDRYNEFHRAYLHKIFAAIRARFDILLNTGTKFEKKMFVYFIIKLANCLCYDWMDNFYGVLRSD